MSFRNPSISAEATRRALVPDDLSINNEQQRELDVAELRELERTEYHLHAPTVPEPSALAIAPRRSFLDRLLRR